VSRCLSEEALERAAAELATDAERAHLATCVTCAARRRRLTTDLAQITLTLVGSPMPRVDRRRTMRRWAAIASASALAAGMILWIEVAAWRVVQRIPDAAQAEQMAALSDVSTTLFSLDGEPARVHEDDAVPALQADDDDDDTLDGSQVEPGGTS
jgi:hypothetical protein